MAPLLVIAAFIIGAVIGIYFGRAYTRHLLADWDREDKS